MCSEGKCLNLKFAGMLTNCRGRSKWRRSSEEGTDLGTEAESAYGPGGQRGVAGRREVEVTKHLLCASISVKALAGYLS